MKGNIESDYSMVGPNYMLLALSSTFMVKKFGSVLRSLVSLNSAGGQLKGSSLRLILRVFEINL